MPILLPVQYHSKKYPPGIAPVLTEVARHFDVCGIEPYGRYSLHTKYAAHGRVVCSATNLCAIRTQKTWIDEYNMLI